MRLYPGKRQTSLHRLQADQEQTDTADPGARANADACAGGTVPACTRQSPPGFGETLRLLLALGTPRSA